jgi:hypothetical protein
LSKLKIKITRPKKIKKKIKIKKSFKKLKYFLRKMRKAYNHPNN